MKARLLVRQRVEVNSTAFAELVVWELPKPSPGSQHNHKYRLALVCRGQCVLRYDNEAVKGDHRHVDGREAPYRFESIRQLASDFFADVQRHQDEHLDD
jgi:hypothetical protein